MIIYYKKPTGEIVGTVDGRIHTEEQLKIWIGDPQETDRIIINWKPIKWFDKDGNEVDQFDKDEKGIPKAFTADFEPDHGQAELVMSFDRNQQTNKKENIYHYKIDIKTKAIIKK